MKVLIANWKCLGSESALSNLNEWVCGRSASEAKLIVLLPAPFLGVWRKYQWPAWVRLGAQTVHPRSGAFTGAFHAGMLKDVGCEYVCIGHSERRGIFGENDDFVVEQYHSVLQEGLQPILCIGEPKDGGLGSKAERLSWLKNQLEVVLTPQAIEKHKNRDIIIAYEPGWAIGSSQAAPADDVAQLTETLDDWLTSCIGDSVQRLWCYGGSVNASNMQVFTQAGKIEGLLVGRASFDKQVIQRLVTQC